MSTILVNCETVHFGSALGVPGFLLQLCRSLAKHHELVFAVNDSMSDSDINDLPELPGRTDRIGNLSSLEQVVVENAVELLPHHFQEQRFGLPAIQIFHDMHVFDIPWKYGDSAPHLQNKMRKCAQSAAAVVTEFPRTYFELERVLGVSLPALFLTESPLMLETASNDPACPAGAATVGDTRKALLYPGQLQAHKNHEALIVAAGMMRQQGLAFELWFPGTDFSAELTAHLKATACDHGVDDRCLFLGHITDEHLIDLYSRCHGVVVPSLAEGGAYVAMEAIAAGKPVAVNRISAAVLHLQSIAASVSWFDSREINQTVSAMTALLNADPGEAFRQNETARNAISIMNWDRVASHFDRIIDHVLTSAPKPRLSIGPGGQDIRYI